MVKRISKFISFFRALYAGYFWKFIFVILLGFLGSILEAIGVSVIVPLFSFIVEGGVLGDDKVTRAIHSFFTALNLEMTITVLLIFMVSMFVAKAIANWFLGYVTITITTNFERDMKLRLYRATLGAEWPFLMKQKLGYLDGTILGDIPTAAGLLKSLSVLVSDIASFIVYLGIAFLISPFLTSVIAGFGIVFFLLLKPTLTRLKNYSRELLHLGKYTNHQMSESILGLKTVKAMNVEKDMAESLRKSFEKFSELRIKQFMIKGISSNILQPVTMIFIVFAFLFSYSQPAFNLASFIAVLYLIQRSFVFMDKVQGAIHLVNNVVPGVEHVVRIQRDIRENQEHDEGAEPFLFSDSLEFKKVGFAYEERKGALRDVSFRVKKGEMIGIVGPSGAGKTTVVDLLLRLFNPQMGAILLDGVPVARIGLGEWRRNIGYVSQDIFLQNDTIKNNIRFYNDSLSDAEIEEVAHAAHLHDFIAAQPDGFHTSVGERGVMLSVGQRQRIILARVLARRPKILVLDEATSALDNESEAAIKSALEKFRGGMTIISIAHRLSTVLHADRIVAIENGRVVEEGRPEELMKDKGSYLHRAYNS